MNPQQAESDAMAAFLASRSGNISLEERARLWAIAEREVEKQMKVKQGAGDGKNQNNQA
jgi:hypothetical protein